MIILMRARKMIQDFSRLMIRVTPNQRPANKTRWLKIQNCH